MVYIKKCGKLRKHGMYREREASEELWFTDNHSQAQVWELDVQALSREIDSLQPGQYYNDLNETYVIFICTFDPLEKGAYIYNIQNQCTNIQDCDYNDESHTIFLNTKGKKGNISDDLKVFLKAVDGMFDSSVKSATIKKRIADIVDNEKWRKSYMFQDMRDIGNVRKGKEEFALTLVRKGKITIEEASEELGTPVENLKAKLEESK